jgi:uncharacterized membrane protein YbhN (UPF0104 family)
MKAQSVLKAGLRWAGTLLALGYVIWKTDFSGFNAQFPIWAWFALLLLYFASKVLSTFRSKRLLECIRFKSNMYFNVKLYAKGMFYNLLLPGGVGGDAWKVWYLSKNKGLPWKETAAAFLYERLSGMAALLGLGGLLTMPYFPMFRAKILTAVLLALPTGWWLSRRLFSAFHAEFVVGNVLSIGVQLLQGIGFLILAYSVNSEINVGLACGLFFLSSVASALPFSIGGIGAREVVFLWLGSQTGLTAHEAIIVSFGLTLAHILVSLLGAFLSLKEREEQREIH